MSTRCTFRIPSWAHQGAVTVDNECSCWQANCRGIRCIRSRPLKVAFIYCCVNCGGAGFQLNLMTEAAFHLIWFLVVSVWFREGTWTYFFFFIEYSTLSCVTTDAQSEAPSVKHKQLKLVFLFTTSAPICFMVTLARIWCVWRTFPHTEAETDRGRSVHRVWQHQQFKHTE